MGILSFLFGCSNKKTIDAQKSRYFVRNSKTNEVFYSYTTVGSLLPVYKKIGTQHPTKFKVLSQTFATDEDVVFYTYKTVEQATAKGFEVDANFPNLFAKNSLTKKWFYTDKLLAVDYPTTQIHSSRYISDKNKVYFNEKNSENAHFQVVVPVQDIASFKLFYKNQKTASTLAKDKHWFYVEGVRLPIPSAQTKVVPLSSNFPWQFLHQDTLHFIYPSYRNSVNMNKDLPPNFMFSEGKIVGKSKYDTFYHFKLNGFKNASLIENSSWLKDANGLYYLQNGKLKKITNNHFTVFDYNSKFSNYLRTENTLFASYYNHNTTFSAVAKIINADFVIDHNTVFYEGVAIENCDAATFISFNHAFMDKNYYYYNTNPNKNREPMPHWAYNELKSGKLKWRYFSDIEMKYDYTIYKRYWNGFLVNTKVPTETNTDSNLLTITLKNIERRTLQLAAPLEETLQLYFRENYNDAIAKPKNHTLKLITLNTYNYKKIVPETVITFQVALPNTITNGNKKTYKSSYFVSLSSIAPPKKDSYNELFIDCKVALKFLK